MVFAQLYKIRTRLIYRFTFEPLFALPVAAFIPLGGFTEPASASTKFHRFALRSCLCVHSFSKVLDNNSGIPSTRPSSGGRCGVFQNNAHHDRCNQGRWRPCNAFHKQDNASRSYALHVSWIGMRKVLIGLAKPLVSENPHRRLSAVSSPFRVPLPRMRPARLSAAASRSHPCQRFVITRTL